MVLQLLVVVPILDTLLDVILEPFLIRLGHFLNKNNDQRMKR